MNKTEFSELFRSALSKNGLKTDYTEETEELLNKYIYILLETNKQFNLTAIRDEQSAIYRHLVDIMYALPLIPEKSRLLDVGSGGGIPAIPLAILRPDITVTALDATGKKVDFINRAIIELGLKNAGALCARAEELAAEKLYREKYSTVTARAVAELCELSELCIPLCAVGGYFIAFKGRNALEELSKAEKGIAIFGCDKPKTLSFTLKSTEDEEERYIFSFEKIRPTPTIYPRRYAQIIKNPL